MKLATLLLAVGVMANCGGNANTYLPTFDLRQEVCSLPFQGINCSQQSGGGGIGASGGGIGWGGRRRDTRTSGSEVFALYPADAPAFDVDEFIARCGSTLARDISHAGFEVTITLRDRGVTLDYRSTTTTGHLALQARREGEMLVVDIEGFETSAE